MYKLSSACRQSLKMNPTPQKFWKSYKQPLKGLILLKDTWHHTQVICCLHFVVRNCPQTLAPCQNHQLAAQKMKGHLVAFWPF